MVDREHMRELLQRVADGALPVDEALASLRSLPFEDLGFAKVDHHRSLRTGVAEVVYCEGKTPRQVAEIIASLAEHSGQVLGTRAGPEHFEAARQSVDDLHYDESARAIWLDRDPDRERADGVLIVAAGTSDLPVAREAELTLDLLGQRAPMITDVGVAGVHRLLHHVRTLQAATTLIVVAGMEGALPSVVAGLVDAPVIAVPTSVGYGASFQGVTALLAMLNSCAAGVGVVNIDNGYGAACLAAMINRRADHDGAGQGGRAVMTTAPPTDLERLRTLVRDCGSALVAYSGGVDSALVAAVAAEQLGEQALACIGASPSYPERERVAAIALAERIGIRLRIIETREHLDPRYQANGGDRCYFCKSELFDVLRATAEEAGLAVVLDGSNADDTGDDRPGLRAATERGVRSPLLEAGLGKEQVRACARRLELPVWDKPAMACLASRVPQGTPVEPALLQRIEQAEDVLARLGFTQFRVRDHGAVARIEVAEADLERAVAAREHLVESVRAVGYRFVTLDLAGYRTGSMNEARANDRQGATGGGGS